MFRRLTGATIAALLFVTSSAGVPALARAHGHGPDVLVVGGTPAGVAAAVAAARRGAAVTLVSNRPVLGGVLTDAMMDQWCLNLAPNGDSIEGGIFREMYGALGDSFTPRAAAHVFSALVADEPLISVVMNARPVAVHVTTDVDDRVVDSITFSSRGKRDVTIAAPYVIDATDDGDVAAFAGARYTLGRQDTGRDDHMQAVTLMFTIEGVDWPTLAASYDVKRFGPGGSTSRRSWGYTALMAPFVPLSSDVLVSDLNLGHENGGAVTVNAIDILGIDGRSDADLAHARTIAEREAPHLLAFLRNELPGFSAAHIGRFADRIYVRETRHFAGLERLTASDVWDGRIPADSIGLSSYPLDLHATTAGERLAYAPVRHVYGIPFGSMVPRHFENLLLASPAISASHIASGSARVIPTTIEEGEAAGAAAALAHARHLTFAAMAGLSGAIAALCDDLRRGGVILADRART